MRLLAFLAILAASSAGLPGSSTGPEAAKTLRVLTYNIHHGEGVDRKLDLPRIAKIIADQKPDFVAIQEVDQKTKRVGGADTTAELAKLTKMHGRFGKAIDFQGGEYGQTILSRYPIGEFQVHKLPNADGREQRIAVAAVVRIGDDGPTCTFVSTHLDHERDELRQKQAAKLDDLFGTVKGPVILAGDLNATPESKPLAMLSKKWKPANTGQPLLTIPVKKPTRQIDFVLYRPADKLRVIEARVLDEPVASDHRPLLVVLEFAE
jgi:endonuclease/exonuclease/phosphatase family metal-dependent hydrolase